MKKLIENWRRYSEQDETPGLNKAISHPTVAKDLKLMNTRPEVSDLLNKVISAVKDQLPNLSDNIIAQAVKDVFLTLKDVGNDASKLASDVGADVSKLANDTFKEVHAAVNPYNSDVDQTDDEKKDLDTDSDQ